MKIYSINSGIQTKNYSNSKIRKGLGNEPVIKEPEKAAQPAFKGTKGATIGVALAGAGSIFGMFTIAIATLSNPIGWGAGAAMYFGSVATTLAGGYAGHKIEDAIKETKNNKKKN